ncbi:DUF4177 domain-containing protein [Brevibacillus fluminis]|uniref:DUF4177 domain-containing protein n=1 Tax=Brevibacillus fluminis TaxID=511487 RepID=A0A3M8DVW7_9BACL|nr:DUF4177 domain-containing protein [Brevibacillus fluminis]RNB91639.1 DUF4177 domain-containing protein [Brevibacillus fluminis]
MDKWEYRTVKYLTTGFFGGKLDETEFDKILNEMGEEGWELVSCFDTNQTHGSSREVVSVFKRKK